MQTSTSSTLGFRVAELMEPTAVDGRYDADAQLWVGTGVTACGTLLHSGTNCRTVEGTKTNCGYDSDVLYDQCSDSDLDED